MDSFVSNFCLLSRDEKGLERTNCVQVGAWDWELGEHVRGIGKDVGSS